ncbi:CG3532 [Drosophila busckii]|uniref:CG3532 n=1 Tax=Drosophila busckii TaxID=30019 RepID=A0A0M5JCY2_DROBS|nr:GRIP and coiled-coil domain-containing protein 2 [Drosophila busckii]ALC47681.1 CG3532 [Drosophila busckii]
METSPRESQLQKNPIEALSKDEIISKYKGLLSIAKKAKQAKDELTEENRQFKEAIQRSAAKQTSLVAMQEMLQDFTDKNLLLTEQVSNLNRKTKEDAERQQQLEIENESLKRQLGRLSDENDELLADVERMETVMQQVNSIGNDQRKNLELLEADVARIKEAEAQNAILRQQADLAAEQTQQHEAKLQELQQKYENVKQLNSEQRKKFNSLKDRFIDVHRKLKNLKECKCVLLETQHEYAASVSKWQQEIIKASQLLCGKMTALQQENEQLKKQPQATRTSNSNNRLLQKVYELERLAKLAKLQQQEVEPTTTTTTTTTTLQAEQTQDARTRTSNSNNRMLQKVYELERLAKLAKLQLEDVVTTTTTTTAQQAEHLLTKANNSANIVNQPEASQQNGSSVNKELWLNRLYKMQQLAEQLQQERSQQKCEMQHLGPAEAELLQRQEELQTRYQLKEHEHSELLAEMRELNEALKGRGDFIYRLQEQQAKSREEQQALTEALAERTLQVEHLQSRIDKLDQLNGDAQSDVLSTSTISRAEELNRLRELDDGYEEKYHKLRGLAAKLKKKLQEQTLQIQSMEQVGGANLEEEMQSIKQAQAQLQEDLNAARAENQKLKAKDKAKGTNVLSLEIDAAEKSLAEVSAKLLAKSNDVESFKEALASKESSITQLQQQIDILEQAQKSEAEHGKQLKQQIDRMQSQLKDAVHGKQQALMEAKQLEQSVEQQKQQVEQLNLQLAEHTQQYECKLKQLQQQLTDSTAQLETHQGTHTHLETALRQAERAHEQLQLEYTEYKLKAQSVLRKQQNRDTDKEYEQETELASLRSNEQKLRASNESYAQRILELDARVEKLQQTNTQLQRRSQDLVALLDELREQNETQTEESHRQLQQQQQQLLQQHRQQLEQMDEAHKTRQKQLQLEIEQLQKASKANLSINQANSQATPAAAVVASSLEQSKIDYLLDHETVSDSLAQLAAQRKISTASRRSHDFMPLDELLNTSLNAISSDTVTTISNFGRSISQEQDCNGSEVEGQGELQATLVATKDRLHKQETRVRHLTALLAENEQDLAKLTQMNDMLKEELRRQERSEEREQHMHNSEYLKNVFLKFLTLNNTDEKQRLVPVLNTILRLSRNEMDMLNAVAKGQKVNTDGNNRSWTGFLSAWSGSGGGAGNAANNNN